MMVKVSGGGHSAKAVLAHFKYIDRHGELEIETDDGDQLRGRRVEAGLIEEWDLEADAADSRSPYDGASGRKPAKLVHNLVLSMPAGTSPSRLMAASQAFARAQFAFQHRYAMVLHTDQAHPHVHPLVKAMSERGQRLHVRKETLRQWRQEFAKHLRAYGVEADATERAVRGKSKTGQPDRIYRSERGSRSTRIRDCVTAIAGELKQGRLRVEPGKAKLIQTRMQVEQGWRAVHDRLLREGHSALAAEVGRFAERLPPARTDRERIAGELLERVRTHRAREQERTLVTASCIWSLSIRHLSTTDCHKRRLPGRASGASGTLRDI
jgi:hypothetical protein